MDIQYESANKGASCQYQQNITNERSKTFTKNEKKYELDENKIPNFRRANKIHLTRIMYSNNVYMPLTIDSPDIKRDKNNTSKTTTL